MKSITKFFLICLLLYSSVYAQDEQIDIVTYYPPPIGVYDELRAGLFKDFSLPDQYFLNLDGRSKIRALNISAEGGGISQRALLQVGSHFESPGSNDRATAYFHDVGDDKVGLCGETLGSGTFRTYYAIYGYAHSTDEINKGVFGLAEGTPTSTDHGVEGEGPGYGSEIGLIGKGNRCGVMVNTNKDEGINANYIENSGVMAFSETNRGLFSRVYNVGSNRHAGYFVGENGAPALCARGADSGGVYGEGVYGIYADSDSTYAGYFKANRNAMFVSSDISTNIATQTNQGYSPEIVSSDNDCIITMDSDAFYSWNSTGNVYIYAPDGKDAYFGVWNVYGLLYPFSYIALHSKDNWVTRAFIMSSHRIELAPGQESAGDRYVYFNGNVYIGSGVGGDPLDPAHDLAEPFDLIDKDKLEPGDVVVIDESGKCLRKSDRPYDSHVAGIISSEEQAALVIGYRKDKSCDKPLALAGQAVCKVDASYAKINPGDLLTTSSTPGHAMKAEPVVEEHGRTIYPTGTILGVALEGLDKGKGKIMVLVGLE